MRGHMPRHILANLLKVGAFWLLPGALVLAPKPFVKMSALWSSLEQCVRAIDLSCMNCFTKWKCVLMCLSVSCNQPGGMDAFAIAFMLSVLTVAHVSGWSRVHSRHLRMHPGSCSDPSLAKISTVSVG